MATNGFFRMEIDLGAVLVFTLENYTINVCFRHDLNVDDIEIIVTIEIIKNRVKPFLITMPHGIDRQVIQLTFFINLRTV